MKPITLKNPIKRGDKEINKVTIREPKGGELRGVSLGDFSELNVDVILKVLPRVSTPALTEQEGEGLRLMDLVSIGFAMMGTNDDDTLGNGTTPKP